MSAKKLLLLLPVLSLMACANGDRGTRYAATADSTSVQSEEGSTSPAVPAANTSAIIPGHKIIRTADLQCKVPNVFNATTRLEQLVRSVGGIVQESQLSNRNTEIKTAYYKPDSLKQLQTYTTTSFITLRVPYMYLDSVVNAIPAMANFIDSRTLKQSDVTYQYLANELKNQSGDNTQTTAQALHLAKKSREPIEVQQYNDSRQEEKIGRKIENMQLMDSVSYATITVAFSQPGQVYTQIIVNAAYVTATPFMLQCKAALNNGWDIVKAIAVAFLTIWPLLLVAALALLAYKIVVRRPLLLAKK